MMADYEYTFATNLQKKLKTKVIGRIFCSVINSDELYVRIMRENETDFKMYIGNFSERIRNCWSTDSAMYEVMQQYREFVTKKYFY